MAVLLIAAFIGFALLLALRLRPAQWGPVQKQIPPLRQTRRLVRHSFERPAPETGTDQLYWLLSTQSVQPGLSGHSHLPGCTPDHSGTNGFDASNCGGHAPVVHGH